MKTSFAEKSTGKPVKTLPVSAWLVSGWLACVLVAQALTEAELTQLDAVATGYLTAQAAAQEAAYAGGGKYQQVAEGEVANPPAGGHLYAGVAEYTGPGGAGWVGQFRYVDGTGVTWVKAVNHGPAAEEYRTRAWALKVAEPR